MAAQTLCTTAPVERITETLETPTQLLLLLLLTSEHLHQNSASQTTRLASIEHRLTVIDQVPVTLVIAQETCKIPGSLLSGRAEL